MVQCLVSLTLTRCPFHTSSLIPKLRSINNFLFLFFFYIMVIYKCLFLYFKNKMTNSLPIFAGKETSRTAGSKFTIYGMSFLLNRWVVNCWKKKNNKENFEYDDPTPSNRKNKFQTLFPEWNHPWDYIKKNLPKLVKYKHKPRFQRPMVATIKPFLFGVTIFIPYIRGWLPKRLVRHLIHSFSLNLDLKFSSYKCSV